MTRDQLEAFLVDLEAVYRKHEMIITGSHLEVWDGRWSNAPQSEIGPRIEGEIKELRESSIVEEEPTP